MKIRSLWLRNFRNFENLKVNFENGLNVFVGPNGQGKTNILESIHFACKGGSFRPGQMSSLIRRGQDLPAQIQAQIQKDSLDFTEDVHLADNRKSLQLNGKRSSSTDLQKRFACVLFSPESLSAIKDGPEQRRQLVDDLILTWEPDKASLLADYKKCLKARNRLLREHKSGLQSLELTKDLLQSLDVRYFALSEEVTAERLRALREVQVDLQSTYSYLSGGKTVDISVDYLIHSESAFRWTSQQVNAAIRKRKAELELAELSSGISLVGPQKHDIRFLFAGEDTRYYCSQGQQRALILAFKMAQVTGYRKRYGHDPILLLDDVFSELDLEKQKLLTEFLKEIRSQVFLTTTDFNWSDEVKFSRDLSVFQIRDGRIK